MVSKKSHADCYCVFDSSRGAVCLEDEVLNNLTNFFMKADGKIQRSYSMDIIEKGRAAIIGGLHGSYFNSILCDFEIGNKI